MAQTASYDPLSPTPYQAQPLPEQPAAPQPAVAVPSPLPPSPGFQFEGHGNISKGGAVAGILDNVLRGFMQGKSMAEAKKSLQLKKKSDDLNASYTADAQRLWTITQKQIAENGKIDQNSDEWKQAEAAVNGSWGAMQDFRNSVLTDAGGKKKGKKADAQRTPAEVLSDPKATPVEKAQALQAMSAKLGPPIKGQIQNYAAQAQARAQNPQVQESDLRAKAGLELGQLRTQKEPLTEQQQARAKQLENYLAPPLKESGTTRMYESPDKSERKWLVPGQEPNGWNAVESSAQAGGKPVRAFKIAANGKPTSVLLDPKTNQEIPGSENSEIVPPSGMLQHISQGHYMYVDTNGDVHDVPITRTTTPVLPKPSSEAGGGQATSTHTINPYPNPEDQPPDVSLAFNKAWAKPDWKLTTLSPQDEAKFQAWAKLNPKAVAGELNNPKADYDVRGHWLAAQRNDPAATLVLNPWDGKMHGNDKFKTPYNGTFSNESMYATPDAPYWDGDKLTTKDGRVVADETPKSSHVPKRVKPPTVDSAAGHQTSSNGDRIIGHKGPISKAKVDALDKDTSIEYQKATDAYQKAVDDLNDPALKLTEDQKNTAKKKYYDRLQKENHDIGVEHSQRMRDLGLIPAEDSSSSKKDPAGIL